MNLRHTSAVIPAYNVCDQLGAVLSQVLDYLPRNRVCVVDDGSTDGTSGIAEKHRVTLVRHPVNLGKGEALKTGFKACLAESTDAVFTLDGDGQHDPRRLPDFLLTMEKTGCDLVVGTRPFKHGEMPPDRILSNQISSLIASLVAGSRIYDSQCGFRLYRRSVLEGVFPKSSRYEMETEMLVMAKRNGFRIGWCEVPNRYSGQKSHIRRIRDTIRFLRLMTRFL